MKVVLAFAVAAVAVAVLLTEAKQCLDNACPTWDKDKYYIHVIPHTHDDVGWQVTVDQYYWGGVEYIIDGVVHELQADPNKRFIYVEMAYFWRWWLTKDERVREDVKKLVNNGQLEFANGGWSSHDEATTHYVGIIDQMTFGLMRLNETFGECGRPLSGWQIDDFGHSKENAALYAQMGYQSIYFARLHHDDRDKRHKDKTMQVIWRASQDLGDKGNLFASAFMYHYNAPDGFGDDAKPFIDIREEYGAPTGYNIDSEIDSFIAMVQQYAAAYRTNHLLLTFGDDFTYTNANHYFSNIDILIKNMNERVANGTSNYVAQYSTPTCYTKAVAEAEAPTPWPTKDDDFFPYADGDQSYWTGYFSSRPTLKGFLRDKSNVYQVCRQQGALHNIAHGDAEGLGESLALAQHHDGISGTARQAVTQDYALRIARGLEGCQTILDGVLDNSRNQPASPTNVFCPLVNNSICDVSQNNDAFDVTVFSGLARKRTEVIRIPVSGEAYTVTIAGQTDVIPSQVQKTFKTGQLAVTGQVADNELVFSADIGALGYTTFSISKTKSESWSEENGSGAGIDDNSASSSESSESEETNDDLEIENDLIKITFDAGTGLVSSHTDKQSGKETKVSQNFYWYTPSIDGQASGAYIFATAKNDKTLVTAQPVKTEKVVGDLFQEVRQTFADWTTQIVRVTKDKQYAEFVWTVGPVPVDEGSGVGKEIVSVFTTDLQTNKVFFTDANGRQILKRTRDFYPQFQYVDTEPIAGNYYPVNTRIFINDGTTQLTVLTDRSQGGSSIVDGQLELMVHRRLLRDDGRGVGEALNETQSGETDVGPGLVARGRHLLIVSSADPVAAAALHRPIAQELFYSPVLTFSASTGSSKRKDAASAQFTGLANPVPAEVNIVTLSDWYKHQDEIILRFEHSYQTVETTVKETTVKLNDLLTGITITECQELTLGANRPISELTGSWFNKRQDGKYDGKSPRAQKKQKKNALQRHANGDITVTLHPFDIATTVCKVTRG